MNASADTHTPFAPTLEPVVFFEGAGRRVILDELFDAVDSGAPICLLTGSNGSGKSALVSQLTGRFEHVADVLFLPQPKLPVAELIHALLEQIGLEDLAQTTDGAERQLVDNLKRRRAAGRRTVVVVEEAQSAASATLRSLHRMCQSGGTDPWLQLLVFADADAVGTDALPRLLTPVARMLEMPSLDVASVKAYCNQQLALAGWEESKWIDDSLATELHSLCNGSFRRLNLLAAATVEHNATAGNNLLDSDGLKSVVKEFGLSAPRRQTVQFTALSGIVDRFTRALLRSPFSLRKALPAVACAAVAVSALILWSALRDAPEMSNVVLAEKPALPVVVAEPRMIAAQPNGPVEPVAPTENPAVAAVTQSAAATDSQPVIASDDSVAAETVDEARLGDPRVALFGSAIAELANRVSSAGDGAFALRTSDATPSVLQLVKRVDPLNFALGQRVSPTSAIAVPRVNILGNPADSIDDWFLQSASWLDAEAADRYSIQLLLVSRSTDKLRDFLEQLPANVDKASLYAFPTERDDRELMLVVFGNYPDAGTARAAIEDLPRSLRRLQPFVRSLSSLRDVIEAI